jgi:cyclomaltodextrinase / maltogenic alpha-amylase / neopullulanase
MTMKRTTVAPPRRTLLWVFATAIVGCGSGGALSDRLAGEDAGDDRAAIVADGSVAPTNDGGSADSTNPTAADRGIGNEAPDATPANEAGDGTSSNAGGDAGTAGEEADGGPANIGPINLASSTVYSVYVPIFSATGNLAGVTAQLPRIHSLGFDVIYLLPVTAASTSTTPPVSSCNQGAEGSVGSPYEVKDYGSIDPSLGTSQDLIDLVQTAHGLGMHVILDEVLNHTSWDNALVGQHPEYYLHCDGDRMNPASIEIGANFFKDVAQLDYITEPDLGLRAYMTNMLLSWITTYDVDGFRFDTADDPYGPNRLIPLDFWESLRSALLAAKPGLVMLGEEEDPDLAQAAFDLDYGWHLDGIYTPPAGGLQQVAGSGASSTYPASLLEQGWTYQKTGYPAKMLHLSLMQDWDLGEDLNLYGGVAGTMAAAVFDFTIDGVPMIFNGEEVGNDASGVNTHTKIDWNTPDSAMFAAFYASLLALRNAHTALQQGALTWVTNSASGQVASYTRSDSSGTFLVLINFSDGPVIGTVSSLPAASIWRDDSPFGSPGGMSHTAPPSFSLAARDFAVFEAE